MGSLTYSKGATPRELVLEACRRNNTSLLSEVLTSLPTPEKIADLLNNAKDGVGNHCLHIAASYGSCTQPAPPQLLVDQFTNYFDAQTKSSTPSSTKKISKSIPSTAWSAKPLCTKPSASSTPSPPHNGTPHTRSLNCSSTLGRTRGYATRRS